jgi:hypothetical protein
MAKRPEIQLIDDLDGTDADTTVKFSVEGVHYEIDLSTAHAAEFQAVLAPFIAAARKATGASRKVTGASRPPSRERRPQAPERPSVRRSPAKIPIAAEDIQGSAFRGWDDGDNPSR